MKSIPHPRRSDDSIRPRLSLVPSSSSETSTGWNDPQPTHELRLTFRELALLYKSLQAAKTLGALSPNDELLDDTIQLLDQALNRAR